MAVKSTTMQCRARERRYSNAAIVKMGRYLIEQSPGSSVERGERIDKATIAPGRSAIHGVVMSTGWIKELYPPSRFVFHRVVLVISCR